MKKIELLSPAGTIKNMRYAFAYGADAIYAGQPRYSLRVRNNDFLEDNLAIGIEEAHKLGKKFYLTSNIMPHNSKIKTFIEDMEPIIAMKPDALIMADPGLIMMVRETWPDMPVHLSVQANTVNYAAVRFWQSVGIERIILSRELSLDEIAEIRQQCPDMELEVFVHGALCIAYSGRCLLSGYFNHRDPNQGTCTNACRWEYKTTPAEQNAEGVYKPVTSNMGDQRNQASDQVVFIEEKGRPGEQMPMEEDEHGTYIMNSKDLRAVEHVHRLVEIGVDSLKIEGRTKSHYYVSRTAQSYKQAINDALSGKEFNPELLGVLENLANRGYTDGFYKRHHTHEYQNYMQGNSVNRQQQFVGEVTHYDKATGLADIDVKNKILVGDRLELVQPSGNKEIILDSMQDMNGNAMNEAPGGGYQVRIPLPESMAELGLIARYIDTPIAT
ncbi:MAG: tRNA 5-hydroxyuridine modification protein YegQ [Gammaproteobacteria bacterium]|nr:tRNA 5-hydroxyuridine modification protein YegQ [Gammaproteobacteria bacterium]MCW9006164.1 tRNA 5-hydroxyuridine modification protein YegQ [Gammaproteobacteria bacterium]